MLPETLEHFREPAQDLIDERGAETALAAAMAVIAGSTKITARSLLSHKEVITHSYGYRRPQDDKTFLIFIDIRIKQMTMSS